MYDELVKRLREVEEMLKMAQFKEAANLIEQAADAIEVLTRENKELSFRAAQLEAMNDALIGETGAADALMVASKPRWIPVTERLPEEYVNVLVFLHSLDWNSIYYSIDHLMEDGQWWKAANSWKHEVTHWMPLPQPPEE